MPNHFFRREALRCAVPALFSASALAAGSALAQPSTAPAAAGNQPDPVILMVPVEVTAPELQAGCWVQMYSQRNFKGEMLTLVGPTELSTLDKGTGRQLKRDIDSLVLGPKATLTVYQHQAFRDKSVKFEPNAREGGLVTKMGFGGRIQSLQLNCAA